MKKLLLYAAALALTASPALAQPRHDSDQRGRPSHQTQQPPRHHQPDRRPDYRGDRRPGPPPHAARPHREWNSWRSQNRNYLRRPAHRFRMPAYRRPNGWYYRRWSFGDILPALFWSSQYWIDNYAAYSLPPPPPGATWVRYGNDALLIDRYSGEVIEVLYGVFY